MSRQNLEESVRGFQPPAYGRVQRSGDSYVATQRFTRRVVELGVRLYRRIERLDQTARLIRDLIEWALRRYHGYAIKERIGAHYRDATIQAHEKKGLVFEHVIPVRYVMALLLQGRITVEQAMHPPTCVLRKRQDTLLERLGLGDSTPDVFRFWQRYHDLHIDIVMHDGTPVDQNTWTLWDHYQRFGR
jgi:hypothetical protein